VDFWSGEKFDGGQTIIAAAPLEQMPLFVRAGSIVPFGPPLQYANEKPADPIELRVYRGADGAFTLYEDEGDNYNYEHGAHSTIPISWNEKSATLTVGKRTGKFPGMLKTRTFRIVWVKPGRGIGAEATAQPAAEIHYTGKAVRVCSRD
jgi:alpha-D-xyloside xylohydrolase